LASRITTAAREGGGKFTEDKRGGWGWYKDENEDEDEDDGRGGEWEVEGC
jgi:hypothetical protein